MKLSLCLLSWGSRKTLLNTLMSYEKNGLFLKAQEKIIFFQEISEADVRIAKKYDLQFWSSKQNIGIGAAYKLMAEKATGDALIFLQNDFVLAEDLRKDDSQLEAAKKLIGENEVDVVLLRHRKFPGKPHWAADHVKGREGAVPTHLFNALYWMENPDRAFPGIVTKNTDKPVFYMTTSQYSEFTDNPCLYRRRWFLEVLGEMHVKNHPDITWPEQVIQPWWQKQTFRIAHGEGLFTHIRLDRPWRSHLGQSSYAFRRTGFYRFLNAFGWFRQLEASLKKFFNPPRICSQDKP